MRNRIILRILLIISFCNFSYAAVLKYSPFFTGLNISYSHIHGFYDLSYGHRYLTDISDVFHPGIEVGKRFYLFQAFYISPSVHYTYGFSKKRLPYPIPLYDGTDVYFDLYKTYSAISVVSRLQFKLPFKVNRTAIFTAAGGGVHYTVYREIFREISGSKRWFNDRFLSNDTHFSASLDLGTSVEFPIKSAKGFSIDYNFRLWQPVLFFDSKDLFPVNKVRYRELFFTHSIGFCYLFSRIF
jgi:hypothetical protein